MKQRICIVVSSTMTVNAFLVEPIKILGKHYHVYLVVNGNSEDITPDLADMTVLPVSLERKISPLKDLLALFRLFCICRKYRFDAVHSVTPKAGLLAMLASFLAGVTFRVHIFTGQVWATRRGFSRWLVKQMDCLIAALATDVLVDSVSQRRFLMDEGVVSPTKSSVLAKGSISGVDTSRFKPDVEARSKIRREFFIEESDIVFLFIGRLNRDKGVVDLATAYAGMENENTRLLIVGPDEGSIREEMEAGLNGCLERVHFVGFSSNPEVYMAAADVLCLPSYREGFGSVIIEAAAVGIPAIGSRIYGVEDAILEGQSGLLFEAGNVVELKDCMEEMAADDGARKRLGDVARKRAIEQFGSDILASAWLEFYRERL